MCHVSEVPYVLHTETASTETSIFYLCSDQTDPTPTGRIGQAHTTGRVAAVGWRNRPAPLIHQPTAERNHGCPTGGSISRKCCPSVQTPKKKGSPLQPCEVFLPFLLSPQTSRLPFFAGASAAVDEAAPPFCFPPPFLLALASGTALGASLITTSAGSAMLAALVPSTLRTLNFAVRVTERPGCRSFKDSRTQLAISNRKNLENKQNAHGVTCMKRRQVSTPFPCFLRFFPPGDYHTSQLLRSPAAGGSRAWRTMTRLRRCEAQPSVSKTAAGSELHCWWTSRLRMAVRERWQGAL